MEDEANPNRPLNPDLVGYPSVEALASAYRATSGEGKKQRERADLLEQQLRSLVTENPRQTVPQRDSNGRFNGSPPSPYDSLSDVGIPADALREAIRMEVRSEFEPLARGFRARGKMVAAHPDYVQFESDVASYVQSDPELNETYNRLFTADPVGAFEYAFLKFGDNRRRVAGETHQGSAEERSHAAIPSSRSGDSRRVSGSQDEVIADAYRRYQETGSPQAAREYAKARLRTVITDEFLGA